MKITEFILSESDLLLEDELIFFGGSFNPWHEGHSSCIELCSTEKPIIIIPDHNPFKNINEFSEKRTTIGEIKIKLSHFKQKTFLYESFFKMNIKNPTNIWIKEIKNKFPLKKLALLVGFDTFAHIHTWIDANDLLNNLDSLYIASRLDNEKVKDFQTLNLKKINPQLNLYFLGHHEYENLSSTKIRENL